MCIRDSSLAIACLKLDKDFGGLSARGSGWTRTTGNRLALPVVLTSARNTLLLRPRSAPVPLSFIRVTFARFGFHFTAGVSSLYNLILQFKQSSLKLLHKSPSII